MRLYFAYGSNMCSILPNWGGVVHGVLWRCSPQHFHILDKYEGVHWGNYRRRHVEVLMPCGTSARAIVYAGTRIHNGIARVRYMTTAVLPGARSFGLPEKYIQELESWLPRRPVGEKKAPVRGRPRPVRFPR